MEGERKLHVLLPSRGITWPLFVELASLSLYFFAWRSAMQIVVVRSTDVLNPDTARYAYAAALLLSGLGLLSFWALRRLFPGIYSRKLIAAAAVAFCGAGTLGMVQTVQPWSFSVASAVVIFLLGYMGGGIHYGFSLAFRDNDHVGRAVGVALGFSVALQAVVRTIAVTEAAFAVCVTLSCMVMFWFGMRPLKDWMYERPPASLPSPVRVASSGLGILCASAVIMTLGYGLLDGILVWRGVAGQLDVDAGPSLACALALVLAGPLFDVREGRFGSLAAVCSMFLLVAAISVAPLSGGLDYVAFASGVYGAFYLMYLTVSFVRLAPALEGTEFVASLGRALGCLLGAVATLGSQSLFVMAGTMASTLVSSVLSVALLLVLVRDVSRGVLADELVDKDTAPCSEKITREDAIALYAERRGLTPRETDVLVPLLTTELGVQEIADGLFISRRVAQRHIAAIYEKTSTQSRVGLYQAFDAWREEDLTR